jgi:hypothetical protein
VIGDEYDIWQRDRELSYANVRDPIEYWVKQQDRYPRLARMALDFLTIQPMEAKCEKVFSAAGNMVVAIRSRLHTEVIGICQILRSWLLAGVIKDPDPGLVPLQLNNDIRDNKSAGDGEDHSNSDSEEEELWQGATKNGRLGRFSLAGHEHCWIAKAIIVCMHIW